MRPDRSTGISKPRFPQIEDFISAVISTVAGVRDYLLPMLLVVSGMVTGQIGNMKLERQNTMRWL